MRPPIYRNKPIDNINDLANAIGFRANIIIQISHNSEKYYVPNKSILKPNGKLRQTYRVKNPLKLIQYSLLHNIIDIVDFPNYLQGSIKDPGSPRDYIRDAGLHAGRDTIIKEDISDFFHSVRANLVYLMWKDFFNFPSNLSQILTNLTTYQGFLPQGAATSSAIANLIFWDREPKLEFEFRQEGFVYSRYVDNITISSIVFIEKDQIRSIISRVYGMFFSVGLKPNRDERGIQSKNKGMTVHNLNINSGKPTLRKTVRAKIRAAVKELENLRNSSDSEEEFNEKYAKVNGRVQLLARLHPHQAQQYLDRLEILRKT